MITRRTSERRRGSSISVFSWVNTTENLKEKCGVFGAYSYSGANVTSIIIKGLMDSQNRGQESFGIAVNGQVYKKVGLVYYGYREDREKIDRIVGYSGIGHVRYSTIGSSESPANFHPMEISSSSEKIWIAHNGTISNTAEMRELLRNEGIKVRESATDTELSGHLLARFFSEKGDWVSTFKRFDEIKNGSYCFTIQTENGDVIAARDSRGYKPLSYGHDKESDTYLVASESYALNHASDIKDVQPGQLIMFNKNGVESHRFAPVKESALCLVEMTYFARPESTIDGMQVAIARRNMGMALHEKFKLKADMVIPVPESAKFAAEGYAKASGIELVHALSKDRPAMRVFIDPEKRDEKAKKMSVVAELVNGKDVIIIDDSIIRGTSSMAFINLMKHAGVKHIALLSTFPPIRYPCFMGIDFSTQEELLAHLVAANEQLEAVGSKIAKALKIDFVGYLDPMSISKAIGRPMSFFCPSCVDGDYSKLNFTPQFSSHPIKEKEEGIKIRS